MVKLFRQRAFSLLELLLVLVCIAAITAWAMHHYQTKQRRAQTAQVQSDIKILQRALDSYFHTVGCKADGTFSQSLQVNCQTQLQPNSDVVCSRPPLVTEYQAEIIKTDQSTDGANPKPIYRLQVRAVMNSAELSSGQMDWYQKELQASPESTNGILIWESLPSNSYVQLGDGSWVLNGSSAFFRSTESKRSGNQTNAEASGSFCAN